MVTVNDILIEAEKLDNEEQAVLLEQLSSLINNKQKKNNGSSLLALSGLGAEIWSNVDIDDYIDNERQW